MNIQKRLNNQNSYDFTFNKDNKTLEIFFAGNLDLYMKLGNGTLIGEENITLSFDITKEDYEIFSIFNELYQDIITANIFEDSCFDYRRTYAYSVLVDKDTSINWISDDGPSELEDRMQMIKVDDDTYRLIFKRNDKSLADGYKSKTGIYVRFRNSGSCYVPFNCCFMKMYQQLQKIDPDYHQYHFEELAYIKKKTMTK